MCNVDGAFLASIGLIVRECHGLMIHGCAWRLGIDTAETAEACAFAANGWDRAFDEADSSQCHCQDQAKAMLASHHSIKFSILLSTL
ncbi:hypothetical protein V6N13_131348 [Hibiscus sabdariffa]|uniref:Uncharacterized protein n=1 Tax=Hibiscus sabdariffa TaxID=183260 RepID=A0ABR2D8E0_9ROSI